MKHIKHFGKFKFKIENTDTGEVKETGYIDNLVLDNYFNQSNSRFNFYYLYLCFGSGSTAPSSTDVTLENMLPGYISSGRYLKYDRVKRGYDAVTKTYTYTLDITFSGTKGAVQGNVSEVGLSYTTRLNNDEFITRALVKDDNGVPTTISLGANDILTVYYTIGYTVDLNNSLLESKTVEIKGQPTNVELHAIGYDRTNWQTPNDIWADEDGTNSGQRYLAWSVNIYCVNYLNAYTGGIDDFSKATPSPGTQVVYKHGTNLSRDIEVDGTNITNKLSTPVVVPPGKGTGTWNFIVLSSSSNSILSSSHSSSVALVFDPPIEKGANDEFTFNNLDVSCRKKL